MDFSFLLDPPAGKHGFLTVDTMGRFCWADGRRARFWGVNISSQSVFADRATVDRAVEVLARSGVNIVRFEALDSRGGLLENREGRPVSVPDPQKLAALDYWLWRLREHGIYAYLNLLDLRTFRAEEGIAQAAVLGRGARPYSMFDPQLITLQKVYAEHLLLHSNPYTGLRYVDDPVLAMVEICNESGFFLTPEVLHSLPAHCERVLRQMWNRWLRDRYGTRDGLAKAWGRNGASLLDESEDPVAETVRLPVLTRQRTAPKVEPQDPRLLDPRRSDGVRFLIQVQEKYFQDMRAFLRSLGLRVPVTGVLSSHHPADGASTRPLDFTAGNYYCDHPQFQRGEWVGALHFTDRNPIRDAGPYGAAPSMASLRWGKKPVVIREWAQPWPNRYRCVSAVEAAAYGSFQDADGLILFGYQLAARPEVLGDFDFQADPTVWGLFGLAGLSYLRGDVRSGSPGVVLLHRPQANPMLSESCNLRTAASWQLRVRNVSAEWEESGQWRPVYPASLPLQDLLRTLASHGQHTGSASHNAVITSTGEVSRYQEKGVLIVSASRTVAIAGEIGRRSWKAGPMTITTTSPIGTVMAVSLDALPLSRSRRYLIKMVTLAENAGQVVTAVGGSAPAPYRLDRSGGPPVMTGGRRQTNGLVARLGSVEVLRLHMANGTWELYRDGDTVRLWCDTNGIDGLLFGKPIRTRAGEVVSVSLKAVRRSASNRSGKCS